MKKIEGFDNYVITDNAEVINTNTGRVLKQSKNPKGYMQIILSCEGKSSTKSIHRLVFEAYNGKIKKGMTVNHIDRDKSNNKINNLELLTQKENLRHAVDIGLIKSGSSCKLSKQVISINPMTLAEKEYGSIRLASKLTNISESSIVNVCKGNRVTAGGLLWKYKL